jgi:hypothetical protein
LIHKHNEKKVSRAWQRGEIRDLGTLGGPDSWAVFVNDRGQVAGASYYSYVIDPLTGNPPVGAFLWENGKMIRRESPWGKHLMWSAELCMLPQFDGISLRVMQTSEAPNVGIRFRVFDLNSCRS